MQALVLVGSQPGNLKAFALGLAASGWFSVTGIEE